MIRKHKIKFGLASALAIIVFVSGVFTSGGYAATTNPYEKEGAKYDEVKELYHKRVNDLFNSKLALMKKGDTGAGTAEIPTGDNCSENNYSTFCLAIAAAEEYENYVVGLQKLRSIVDIPENDLSIESISSGVIGKSAEIDNEIERAKKTLDVALATYNELSGVYRQHLEYEKLIQNLTKYNKKVIEFRKEVEKLPSKFVDASTAECT